MIHDHNANIDAPKGPFQINSRLHSGSKKPKMTKMPDVKQHES